MPPYVPPGPLDADARRQGIIAVTFLVLAIALTALPPAGKQVVASALRASVLRPFLGLQELVVSASQRTLDVQQLQARLDSATARLAVRTTLEEENRRLRALLDLAARVETPWRSAQVLRPGTQGSESIFLLNVGSDDGIPPRAPVITREGLAGVVREVRDDHSIGMDWTHPDFSVSAMSRDGAVYGFVEVRRGLFREEDRLLLTSTPYHTRLESGDEIVTSGIGGVYPRGIPIGRVIELAEEQGGWITSYWVEPYVSPGDVVQVVVLLGSADSVADGAVPPPAFEQDSAVYRGADLSALWPEGETGTREERWNRERLRADSLAALRDEVARLQQTIDQLRGVDSVSTGPGGQP
ncbi:rod shape-determining protein MreC [Gaopeijia maritima]|uniref:Cell shape-determining protein MreC n=1 Tax=Gaopeijia maritima TaxID=3119007 RepID=A0ABU9E9J6_9BACT